MKNTDNETPPQSAPGAGSTLRDKMEMDYRAFRDAPLGPEHSGPYEGIPLASVTINLETGDIASEGSAHWCEHVVWAAAHSGEYFWWFEMENDELKKCFPRQSCTERTHVPRSWTCCPICKSKRPQNTPNQKLTGYSLKCQRMKSPKSPSV